MSLRRGATYSTPKKQKPLNTVSSTEAKLVAVNDVMPQLLWTRYFLEEQGYEIQDNLLYQDNQSAIFLEKIGKVSIGKRTKYITTRYSLINKMGPRPFPQAPMARK